MTEYLRETRETNVRVEIARGTGTAEVSTGEEFLDHMLVTLARHAGFDLEVEAGGDLKHHLIEDVAITLGQAIHDEIPETCRRYGDATVVMDDALVQAALDAGGRAYYRGRVPSSLYDHFMLSLAMNAKIALHVRPIRGTDRHHVIEACFKALGLALAQAMADGGSVFSTKGRVRLERRD